jgi:flagellar protein FlgJ
MTPPTVPLVDSGQLVDAGNLSTLKRAAANGNPQALRAAAQQFESLFVSMMLKSMQQANFKDPLFGSDQGDLYQEMYDDQLAAQMSKGKGLGLADMLVQQLRRSAMGATDSTGTVASKPLINVHGAGASTAIAGAIAGTTAAEASAGTNGTHASAGASGASATSAANACPSSAQQAEFARTLWPDAQQAARQLGVNPVTLLAQAALETNWGRSMPQDASGGASNNLFGIKASSGWSGPAVSSSTQEYSGGIASTVRAQFRSYASASQCFQDYVDLLKGNPRYAAALGTGNDVQAFGSALQQGGYATDPAYASKLTAVAGTLTRALTQGLAGAVAPLKFAAGLPTTDGSGPLQRR